MEWMREAYRLTRKDGAPGIRYRTGVTFLCSYLPHDVLDIPRRSPHVAEAEKGGRGPIHVGGGLPIWSITTEVDEARFVGVERELIPSETLAQNVKDPLGVPEIRKRHD